MSDMAIVSPSSPSHTQKGFQLPMLRHFHAARDDHDEQAQPTPQPQSQQQQQPLPIPGAHASHDHTDATQHMSQSPPDILPTPPDGVRIGEQAQTTRPRAPSTSSAAAAASPRLASLSASFWSPKQPRAESHLYGTSATGRSVSTSFKLSAERGAVGSHAQHPDPDDDDFRAEEIFDDSFEHDGVTLQRRGPAAKREDGEGDATGVFTFSSPYFGPQAVGEGDIPYSPGLGDPAKQSSAARLMSPNWTALTLSQLSLSGSPETRTASVHMPRRPSGRPMHSYSYGQLTGHRPSSVPTEHAIHSVTQQRRLSFQRNQSARAGGGGGALLVSAPPSSYTYSGSPSSASPYGRTGRSSRPGEGRRSASRSRSRSRRKLGDSTGQGINAGERDSDDMQLDGVPSNISRTSTDDDMALSDDDATEDEAEPRSRRIVRRESVGSAYGVSPHSAHSHPYARPSGMRPGAAAQLERTRSGAGTGASSPSASLGLSFNGSPASASAGVLARQYSADQRAGGAGTAAVLNMGNGARHHPYAAPPNSNSHLGRYAYSPNQASTLSELGALATSLPAGFSGARRPYADAAGPSAATSLGGSDDETEDDDGTEDDETDEDSDVDERMATSRDGLSAMSAAASALTHQNGYGSVSVANRAMPFSSTPAPSVPGASSTAAAASAIRTRLGGSSSCSAFISKLWYLMSNPDLYADYIRWSVSGDSVILYTEIERSERFARDVLPKLFKHNNVASFVRQLNLYGFQRTQSARLLDAEEARLAPTRLAQGGDPALSSSPSAVHNGTGPSGIPTTAAAFYGPHSSFSHPHFRRGQEDLLPTLKPRSSKKPKKGGAPDEGADE